MKSISIIIPTFNEVQNIIPLVQKIKVSLNSKINWEIIFVDDNSPDKTYERIKFLKKYYSNIKVIKRFNERGLAGAVLNGLNSCSYEQIIIMDADLQHDPIFILKLLDKMYRNEASIVVASRFIKDSKSNNFHILVFITLKYLCKYH